MNAIRSRVRVFPARVAALCLVLSISLIFWAMDVGAAPTCPEPQCSPPATGTQPADASAAQELASRYAPIVYMKRQSAPCADDGEVFYPSPVEIVLGNPDVTLNDRSGAVVKVAPTAADLFDKPDGYYLDLPGDPHDPGCEYEERFNAFAQGQPPVVYARITADGNKPAVVLQYWLYFYFNDWNNNHESDWEFIQLQFDSATTEDALVTEPASVVYAQHGGGEQAQWNSSKLRKEDGHPVVYTAQGSHASLYAPVVALGKGEAGTGFGCDDATPPSERLAPQARVIPPDVRGPDDPFAWIAFAGQWGERANGEFDGPTGPNDKKAWTDPLEWQEQQRDDSVTVPDDTIGPNAAKAFCRIVAAGSKLLAERGPVALIALLVGFVGSIGATARRTRFTPVIALPLRARRRFGQILRAAFVVLRTHRTVLLRMGVLFVPLGLIASGLQQIVLRRPPVKPVLDLASNTSLSGAVALALGGLGFGIGYWLVLCGVTAAIDDMDAGRPASVMRSLARVRRQFGQLARARTRALLTIALLTITIVGIPLAIRRAVQWTFLEQAILIDDVPPQRAWDVSIRAVEGSWWRTFGFSVAVGWGAIIVGPLVGIAVLLLSSASLAVVNLVSSIIYVVLVPYAAIAFSLLYFDLKEASPAAEQEGAYAGRAQATE